MSPHRDRFQILEARCTPFALEFLRELHNHPKLPEIIARLEHCEGAVLRADIERAFIEVTRGQRDT